MCRDEPGGPDEADIDGSSRILHHLNASPSQFCFPAVPRAHRETLLSLAWVLLPEFSSGLKLEKSACDLQFSVRETLVCVSWQQQNRHC